MSTSARSTRRVRTSPVARTSGDSNNNALLDAGETWTFACSRAFTTPGSYTNTAGAAGTNTQSGLAVSSNSATATVNVTRP